MSETIIQGAPNVRSGLPIYRGRRQQMSLDAILEELRQTAALPLERATTLPAEAYTSDAFFGWEAEHLLRQEWMCVGHLSQIPQAGDFVKIDMLGEPLLVVHGKDGLVRTLSRICPHRAMDIMPPGYGMPGSGPAERREAGLSGGHTRVLMCPYHAWTFELDGGLKGTPEMHLVEGFCREAHGLTAYRTETWHGFVFVNLDGQAEPLAAQFGEMSEALADWGGLSEMELLVEKVWDCDFNWKVLFENFSECYHHVGAHARTLQPLMPAKDCWTEEENRSFIQVHLPLKPAAVADLRQAMEQGIEFPTLPGLDSMRAQEWQLFCAPPCFLLFVGPNQVAWYRLDPLTPDKSRLTTCLLVPKSYRSLPQYETCKATAERALIDFHSEDMDICSAVQRGYYGSGVQRGRLSHLEMPIWLFHRWLAARSQGTWPTVDRPPAESQSRHRSPVPA